MERLLSSIGKGLNPKVKCVINLANRGAGLPDGGLFTADQFGRKARSENKDNPFLAQNTSRGVIEAKAPGADISIVSGSEQNKETIELVQNWCAHMTVERPAFGGVGMVEMMTGLPIGLRHIKCPYANAAGFAGMDKERVGVESHLLSDGGEVAFF